ncbi:MAG: hypothetical protein DRQ13_02840 [Ignavibacteriae bacterium]|nr:MAG: hypothetical protein DRQ13_02840 [Ignavibacteriota bacterium]
MLIDEVKKELNDLRNLADELEAMQSNFIDQEAVSTVLEELDMQINSLEDRYNSFISIPYWYEDWVNE